MNVHPSVLLNWSRASAIAASLASGRPTRALKLGVRVMFAVTGSVLIGIAVGVALWNGVGAGPFDVLVGAIHNRTGVPISVALWASVGVLTVGAVALGQRPGPTTLLGPFVTGAVLQIVTGLLPQQHPGPAVGIAVQTLCVAVVGVGVGCILVARMGAGVGEMLAAAVAERSGKTAPVVRTGFELTWLTAGVIAGGPFGIGTVLWAVLIGPAVAAGYKLVDSAVVAAHGRLRVHANTTRSQ